MSVAYVAIDPDQGMVWLDEEGTTIYWTHRSSITNGQFHYIVRNSHGEEASANVFMVIGS